MRNSFHELEYTYNDFVDNVSWKSEVPQVNKFDSLLTSKWEEASKRGLLRYKLNIKRWKVLPGKFSFLAQLNTDRAENRRAPQNIVSLTQPFNHDAFNFTKIPDNEIMFVIRKMNDGNTPSLNEDQHYLILNVSPIEFGHSLLVPARFKCLPQIVTLDSLHLAINILLLSSSPALRVGFNSLCGFASVNHLHFHVYYLQHPMLLEHMVVRHLSGPCYELVDFPAKGFVFSLDDDRNVDALASNVFQVTNYLQDMNVAHNLYITRGINLTSSESNPMFLDSVRVFVWARKSSSGAKESAAFNPALCELFGHLSIKTEAAYESLVEDEVVSTLNDICSATFSEVREAIKNIFTL